MRSHLIECVTLGISPYYSYEEIMLIMMIQEDTNFLHGILVAYMRHVLKMLPPCSTSCEIHLGFFKSKSPFDCDIDDDAF